MFSKRIVQDKHDREAGHASNQRRKWRNTSTTTNQLTLAACILGVTNTHLTETQHPNQLVEERHERRGTHEMNKRK